MPFLLNDDDDVTLPSYHLPDDHHFPHHSLPHECHDCTYGSFLAAVLWQACYLVYLYHKWYQRDLTSYLTLPSVTKIRYRYN